MNEKPRVPSTPTRQELEAKIDDLERQRAEMIAERERLLAEVQKQSRWLQQSWRKLESERRLVATCNQIQNKEAAKKSAPVTLQQKPSPVQPANSQPNRQPKQAPNKKAIQQFQQLQKGVRR